MARYGMSVITLTRGSAVKQTVKWMPQRGSDTKAGAAHYRHGLRAGFEGFSTISPTRRYVDDFEAGFAEGAAVAERLDAGMREAGEHAGRAIRAALP